MTFRLIEAFSAKLIRDWQRAIDRVVRAFASSGPRGGFTAGTSVACGSRPLGIQTGGIVKPVLGI